MSDCQAGQGLRIRQIQADGRNLVKPLMQSLRTLMRHLALPRFAETDHASLL